MNAKQMGGLVVGALFVCACAGQQTSTDVAAPPENTDTSESVAKETTQDEPAEDAEAPAAPSEVPQFTPGMSVAEAQDAVPSSIERLNIEQEALAAPLMQPELYEPCALQGHHHFKLKVAVWDGKAVGLDVETTPADEKLESCLRQQVS